MEKLREFLGELEKLFEGLPEPPAGFRYALKFDGYRAARVVLEKNPVEASERTVRPGDV